jgi:hypothetical protein
VVKALKHGDIFADPLQSLSDSQEGTNTVTELKGTNPGRQNAGRLDPLPELAKAKQAGLPAALKEEAVKYNEARLSEDDWYAVLKAYGKTGTLKRLQVSTGFPQQKIRYLLHVGIKRLSLPPIETFANKAGINMSLTVKAEETQEVARSSQAIAAVQKRATKEAATAMKTLDQAIQIGSVFGQFIEGLMQGLKSGKSAMLIPKHVTVEALTEIGEVLNKHTQSIDRAVKLVRLTQGEPTERIEHQVGALLAGCSLEELQEAEKTGHIPKSLVSRLGAGSNAIDAEFTRVEGDSIWPTAGKLSEEDDV